ncbi:MAG: hypothetical protein P8045_16815 [Candidatus Thiodiazotropha sp.]
MMELSQLSVLIMVEVIIGLVILSALLLSFALIRKRRIRSAVQHLAERVQSDKPARTKRLKTLLSEHFGYADDQLEQALHNITQAEMRLFQNLINGYMQDNQLYLQQFDVDEENLVSAYQELQPQAGSARPPLTEGGEEEEELQRLQDENQRLSDELRVTMDTMGRMLNEYSSMFAGGNDAPLTREVATAGDETQEEAAEREPLPEADDTEVEIPDLQASDMEMEVLAADPDALLESDAESSALDEEVSEIIDEVMEIADGMNLDRGTEPRPDAATVSNESLLDELEQVDIELPEMGQATIPDKMESEADSKPEPKPEYTPEAESKAEPEPDPGSLEEEWARMLEEDAAQKKTPDNQ